MTNQMCSDKVTLVKPRALKPNGVIGIVTPSWPAHVEFKEKYQHATMGIRKLGFQVKEGSLTSSGKSQGYRSGTPQERAIELMELFDDDRINAIISTIGGQNSASLIPYLDFDLIKQKPKIFCGYSDVTSLHMALLTQTGLVTFYGPAVVPSFGEWPSIDPYTLKYFIKALCKQDAPYLLTPPQRFSNQILNAYTDDWKTIERSYIKHKGWNVLNSGKATAPVIATNLGTLLRSAGTKYFPDLDGCILLTEQMDTSMADYEACFRQLMLMGVFSKLAGLIISKHETFENNSEFSMELLLREIFTEDPGFPIITEFDCGHTTPMLTIAQGTPMKLIAEDQDNLSITVLESMVTPT